MGPRTVIIETISTNNRGRNDSILATISGEEEQEPTAAITTTTTKKQTLDSILGKWSKREGREQGLKRLAGLLKEIDSRLDFKQSPRGWCYTLEGEGTINKGEFDRAEIAINDCRKKGYLSIDFCAENASRIWSGVEEPTVDNIGDFFRIYVRAALRANQLYIPDWWKDEEYYIQMLVEKVDLRSLFAPVCRKYHIPIANAGGWSDLNGRAAMIKRFKEAEEWRGQKCVLLYCGDLDPWGEKIGEQLRQNIKDLQDATGYDPSNLIIDRFGLNREFIEANNLTWIDNLISGSKKDMTKGNYCYSCENQHEDGTQLCRRCNRRLYVQPEFVKDYIRRIGKRKCEANALVVAPEQGRQLAEESILKYLGQDAVSRFEAKREEITARFRRFRRRYPILFNELTTQILLEGKDEEREEEEYE